MQKAVKVLSKEAAILEIEKLKQKSPQPKHLFVKKVADECDSTEYQNSLIREAKALLPEDLKAIIVIMEDKPTSALLVYCPADEELLKRIATALCEALDIQIGAAGLICKNGRFQTKFTTTKETTKQLKKCDEIVGDLVAA